MHLAVYAPEAYSVFVLTPDCMQPSLDCQHQFGPLQHRGTLEIDRSLLTAVAQPLTSDGSDLEFLVNEPFSRRYVEALLQR